MLRLTKLCEVLDIGFGRPIILNVTNVDELFRYLREIGIEEILVTKAEMNLIVYFKVAQSTKVDWSYELNTGKTKEFWGIKLKEIE